MENKTVEMLLCFSVLCSATLFAQDNRIVAHQRTVLTIKKSQLRALAPDAPAGLTKIYSNLGPKVDAYFGREGLVVEGPASRSHVALFIAMPFTPKSNSTVTEVRAAIQWNHHRANQVNLNLFNDAGGTPGTLLAGPVTVTNLPPFGTCCGLAVVTFSSGVCVTAGTQYWVVADTPASGVGSDFEGAWDFLYHTHLVGEQAQGGAWQAANFPDQGVAGAVYGTVP